MNTRSASSGSGLDPDAAAVLAFWHEAGPQRWFAKSDEFDQRFRDTFLTLHYRAARRELDAWQSQAGSALALLVLLDQFPRNAFRGTAHMFATDPLARHYAQGLIDAGFIGQLEPALRLFVCVPFIHSESLADQEYGVSLYREHAPDNVRFAIEHRDIIARFGRFPHRNASLGRITTPEEQQFLDSGGFAG